MRVILTSSSTMLKYGYVDPERLGRFLHELCDSGVELDWYLLGDPSDRASSASLTDSPNFRVLPPVDKHALAALLESYDVGLFWAPMADSDRDPKYFRSAASNKIGEYIAAGLAVAHTGNPGLDFIPSAASFTIDATDPERAARALAVQLGDRSDVEARRSAARAFHCDELNFEQQASPLLEYLLAEDPR